MPESRVRPAVPAAFSPAERAAWLVEALPALYPDARCGLDFSSPLELLVATILAAQCPDTRVNAITPALFARYRTAADYADAPPEQLETLVRAIPFCRQKARAIRGTAVALVARHGGEVPRTLAELTALPGVGRKTANVILGNAYGLDEGIVVDTHVGRLARRLGLTVHDDPVKVEADLMPLVPREQRTKFAHWLIAHGRARCMARKPDCGGCELQARCPTGADKVGSGNAEVGSGEKPGAGGEKDGG